MEMAIIDNDDQDKLPSSSSFDSEDMSTPGSNSSESDET